MIEKEAIPNHMKKVSIVSRKDIPVHLIKRNGKVDQSGELRIFHSHEVLQHILQPSSVFSLAWATLRAGEVIPAHTHDTLNILIVYQGSGRLLLEDTREFFAGDCIVIPPYCEAGFMGEQPDGFHAISIEVGKDKIHISGYT